MTLESISVALINGSSSGLGVSLWSNISGKPGASLITLAGSAAPVNGIYDYTPGSSFTFAASTTYWVALTWTFGVSGGVNWTATPDLTETGLAGWTIGNDHSIVIQNTAAPLVWNIPSPNPARFAVNVVPEPTILGLLGCGMAAFCLVRRKKRNNDRNA